MSRIGKMPIAVPAGVSVTLQGSHVTVKGPKGELERDLNPEISIAQEGGNLIVSRPSDSKLHRSLHGLTRTLVANMVGGVTQGFDKTLEIVGVGYRAEKDGNKLVLRLGFSHLVNVVPPPGLAVTIEGANRIKVVGINKEAVGQLAAEIRALKPPDHYKGKGIRYAGEVIKLKPGKAVGKGAAAK